MVLAGHEQCRNGDCPEASELWELHSTVGRDGTIVLLMDHLSHIIETGPSRPGEGQKADGSYSDRHIREPLAYTL